MEGGRERGRKIISVPKFRRYECCPQWKTRIIYPSHLPQLCCTLCLSRVFLQLCTSMKFLGRRGVQSETLSSLKCWQIFSSLFLHTDIFSSKCPDLWISVILLYCLSLAFFNLLHWRLDRNGWRDPQHFWTHLERFPFHSWAGRTMWEMKINWLP